MATEAIAQPIARFKDLCLDAADAARLGAFWAAALGRTWHAQDNGDGYLTGPTPAHTIWINQVPEPKTVKHRVHLDIYARDLADLEALGATVVPQPSQPGPQAWTLLTDPEGGEFDAFVRDEIPDERLHGLEVDCADAKAQAHWWGRVFGTPVIANDGYFTLEGVPGMPIATMDFAAVPEPKTGKNRVHWDVTVSDVAPLIAAGATVLRERDDEIRWTVMADPEGNEFCAFTD